MQSNGLVVLLTDFGDEDWYVPAMKGVILSVHPGVRIHDFTHRLSPFDIRNAAFVLSCGYAAFPSGTTFCAVVDPGVGTSRTPIAASTDHYYFVCPDNGLLSYVAARESMLAGYRILDERVTAGTPSHTFHGRDIFAPAAAHLAAGVPLSEIAVPIPRITLLAAAGPRPGEEGAVTAHIVHVDRFGNAVLDFHETMFHTFGLVPSDRTLSVAIGKTLIRGLHKTYADVPAKEFLLLIGSAGYVEIAQREGNAAASLTLEPGMEVHITRQS